MCIIVYLLPLMWIHRLICVDTWLMPLTALLCRVFFIGRENRDRDNHRSSTGKLNSKVNNDWSSVHLLYGGFKLTTSVFNKLVIQQ